MKKTPVLTTFFTFFCLGLFAQPVSVKLSDQGKGFSVFRDGTKLLELEEIQFDFRAADSVHVLATSKAQITLLTYYPWINPQGTEEEHQQLDTLYLDILSDYVRLHANPQWARHVQLVMKDLGGSYYGLQETLYPDNDKSPNLKGATVEVQIQNESYRYHENWAAVHSAFFYNSLGYASFFDSFSGGKYRLAQEGKTILTHYTGKLDWYLFTGDHKKIYQSYYSVIGRPKYVPDWACGPIIWRDENTGSEQILDDVRQFTDLQIPFTSLFVDRPYSNGENGWSKMDFSSDFANPEKWIKQLMDDYGVEFMTWVTSATFGDPDFPGLLAGHFGYFDLTNEDAISEFQNRLEKNQYRFGVKGHKIDRAEEHFPLAEKWTDGTNVQERRNKYPYLYAKVTDQILKKTWGRENVNFARAAYHRTQPYLTAIWGGDVRAHWDGLAANIANAMRCSFMGFPNWGTDVGGYLGEGYISKELYTRWLQFGLWTGFYEIKIDGSGGRGRERTPWQYDEAFQKRYAEILTDRMQFIPYVYSLLNTSMDQGPLMKPMAMVYPEDQRFAACWDQYLFGDAFLVAPIYTKENTRSVLLPKGDWYDYDTGKKYAGGRTIQVTKSMNEYPVFVKAGSLHAKGKVIAGNSKRWEKGTDYVDLFFAPGEDCAFDLMNPSEETTAHIAAEKINENKYELSIPGNQLIRNLYILTEGRVLSVVKDGKKTKSKPADRSMTRVDDVSGTTVTIELE